MSIFGRTMGTLEFVTEASDKITGLTPKKYWLSKGATISLWGKKKRFEVRFQYYGKVPEQPNPKQIKAYKFLLDNQDKISKKTAQLIIKFSKKGSDSSDISMDELTDESDINRDCAIKYCMISSNGECSLLIESRSELRHGGDQGIGLIVYPSFRIDIQSGVL